MPLDATSTKELKANLKLAKAKPLAFALALGKKKPEDSVLLMDKNKSGDILLKKVKQVEGIDKQKICCGTIAVDGQKVLLHCQDDPPAGLVKKLRSFLKANGLQSKPVVFGPDGAEFEAEPEESEEGAPAPGGGEGPSREALTARLDALGARAEALSDEAQSQLRPAMNGAFAAIEGDDMAGAAGRLDRVAEALDALERADAAAPRPETDPETAPDTGPEAKPALDPAIAAKWTAASAKVAPLVAEATERGVGDLRKIAAVWSLARQKAEAGDHASALKALPALAKLLSEARATQLGGPDGAAGTDDRARQTWERVRVALDRAVAGAVAAGGPAGPKIGAAWKKVVAMAEAGRHAEALDHAKKVRAALEKVAPAEAAPAGPRMAEPGPQAGPTGAGAAAPQGAQTPPPSPPPNPPPETAPETAPEAVQETAPTMEAAPADTPPEAPPAPAAAPAEAPELAAIPALEEVAGEVLAAHPGLAPARARLDAVAGKAAEFGGTGPADWAKALRGADAELRPEAGAEPEAVAAAISRTEAALDTLEAAIAALVADRKVWRTQRDLLAARLAPIEVHFAHDKEPVKTELAGLVRAVEALERQAEAFDFAGAAAGVPALLARGDTVEALADDLAHYLAVHDDRKTRIDGLAPARGEAIVDAPRDAAVQAFADAEAKAGGRDYEAAVVRLNEVPALCTRFEVNLARFEEVTKWAERLTNTLADIDARPEAHRAHVADGIQRLRALQSGAALDATGDLLVSAQMLNRSGPEAFTVLKILNEVRDYVAAMEDLSADLSALEGHAGREMIEDVIDRLESDRAIAASSAVTRKFRAAIKILQASATARAEAKKAADDFIAYRDRKKTVDAEISGLEARDAAGRAAVPLANARANVAKAEEFRAARDFAAGLKRLEAAADAAGTATALLDMAEEKAQQAGEPADPSKDIVAAMAAYDKAKAYVDGKADAVFDPLIAQADALAGEAQAASAGAQTEETARTVAGKLAEAHAALDRVIEKVACKAGYDALLAELDAAAKAGGSLEGVSENDCIKTEIEALRAEQTAIEALVQPPGLDFPAATTRLHAALRDVQAAERTAALYAALNADYKWISRAERKVREASVKARAAMPGLTDRQSMTEAADTLKTDYKEKVVALWRARKAEEAVALSKKGATLGKQLEKLSRPMEASVADVQKFWVNNLAALAGHANIAWVQPEYDALRAGQADIDALLDSHAYKGAASVAGSASKEVVRLWAIMTDRGPWETARAAATARVEAAEAARNRAVEERVAALRARLTEAERLALQQLYKEAKKIADALPGDCDEVIDDAGVYALFDEARTAAREKLEAAAAEADSITVRPLLERLAGKLDNAGEIGEAGDLAKARAMLGEIPGEVDAAMARAGSNAELDAAAQAAADAADWDTMRAALDKVMELRAGFARQAEASFLVERMVALTNACARCDEKIGEGNPFIAKEALDEAIEHCKWVQLNIGYFEQVMTLANRARQDIAARLTGQPFLDYVADDCQALIEDVEAGLVEATESGQVAAATTRIEAAMDRSHALLALAERHRAFVARQAKVSSDLEALLAHPHRYGIKAELDRARALLESAGAAAAGRDHDTAETEIGQAEALALDARIEADMLANTPPSVDDVKAILARPDGDAALDRIVDQLDPQAQRKTLRVAFEARFGCKLDIHKSNAGQDDLHDDLVADGEKLGPNIRRFYDVMSELPKSHTLDNDSMLLFAFEDQSDAEGSWYSGGSKKQVVMREGDARTSVAYGFGLPHELGEVDEACRPANEERVDFFSWNTLHEVGHAVDDKHRFMAARMGSAEFGNWTEHPDPTPVARAIARHCGGYDHVYVLQYMTGTSDPPVPDCPDGVEADLWETARLRARAHIDAAREGKNPWGSDAVAKKLMIDGRVYHESYKGDWKSYDYAARRQGISGYQFRAPGEWFSELYAAYHSGKLKKGHPSEAWLESLNAE